MSLWSNITSGVGNFLGSLFGGEDKKKKPQVTVAPQQVTTAAPAPQQLQKAAGPTETQTVEQPDNNLHLVLPGDPNSDTFNGLLEKAKTAPAPVIAPAPKPTAIQFSANTLTKALPGAGVVKDVANAVTHSNPVTDIVKPFGEAAAGLAKGAAQVAMSPVNLVKFFNADNQSEADKAREQLKGAVHTGVGIAQAIPRGLTGLGLTLADPFIGKDKGIQYNPGSNLSKAILGDAPVKSLRRGKQDDVAAGKSGWEALGNEFLQGFNDVLPLKGIAEGADSVAASGLKRGINDATSTNLVKATVGDSTESSPGVAASLLEKAPEETAPGVKSVNPAKEADAAQVAAEQAQAEAVKLQAEQAAAAENAPKVTPAPAPEAAPTPTPAPAEAAPVAAPAEVSPSVLNIPPEDLAAYKEARSVASGATPVDTAGEHAFSVNKIAELERRYPGISEPAPTAPAAQAIPLTEAVPQPTAAIEPSRALDQTGAIPQDVTPAAPVETPSAVQQLAEGLRAAEQQSGSDAAALSEARGTRAAAAADASQGLEGEAATIARRQALAGELGHRGDYTGIPGEAGQSLFDALRVEAQRNPDLASRVYTLDNVEEALSRAIRGTNLKGEVVGAPTPGQINLLRQYFGGEVADVVQEAVNSSMSTKARVLQGAGEVAALPKSIMASYDLSATLRQGGVLASRFPKEAAEAAVEQVKYFASKEAFAKGMAEIADRPSYETMLDSGLAVNGTEALSASEEAFVGNLAERIPGLGRGVAASDRAYTGFLTKLRADVFDRIVNDSLDKGIELTQRNIDDISKFINTASGRGDLGAYLEQHANSLSTALFSPRLWKSRLDMLNPVYYAKLSGPARAYALQSAGTFAATAATVLGLAKLAGAEVSTDMRSSDFGKIKVGNSRYDILGGFQQNLVFAWRELTGEKVSSTTGEVTKFAPGVTDIGGGSGLEKATGPFAPNRLSIATDLVQNKENPILSAGSHILSGKDQGGQPVDPLKELTRLFVPLPAAGSWDAANDIGDATNPGDLLKGAIKNAPDLIGVSSQTYGAVPTKDSSKVATEDQGTAMTPESIKKALGNEDYDTAISGLKYSLMKTKSNKASSKQDVAKAQNALEEAQLAKDNVPLDNKGIEARTEAGDYDSAIKGYEHQLKKDQGEDIPESTRQKVKDSITKLKVTRDGGYDPKVIDLYKKTSLSEWRDMGDPESDNYDQKTYDLLYQYDTQLADASVSKNNTKASEKFYSAKKPGKKSGRKGGGGGSVGSNKIGNTPALEKISFGDLAPQKLSSVKIPTIQQVKPGELIKARKISVGKA